MAAALPTIHMFWHGAPLSRVERLSMASFVANGHPVELHTYANQTGVPAGVQVRDAAVVLPRGELFRHRRTGSLGPFADWFRYRLLHARGGIWADTDVVCLRPFDYSDPVIFGWEDARYLNTAVLGLPAGHSLAAWMADACAEPNRLHPYDGIGRRVRKLLRRHLQGDRRDNVRWGEYGPKGITHAARHLGLLGKAKPSAEFYPVACDHWRLIFQSKPLTPNSSAVFHEASRAVHLWHAMMHNEPGFDQNARFPESSVFEVLCQRYNVNIDV
jgi:hypothetical protein